MSERSQVLIAGGGIAGLEALLALHDLVGDRIEITLVAPGPDFSYKPLAVDEPFSAQPPEHRALAPAVEELGGRFVQRGIERVLPSEHQVELDDGSRLDYDIAVIGVGGRARPAFREAITFLTPEDRWRIAALLKDAAGEPGAQRSLAFVVPSSNTWPLPIYELALMTARRAEELGVRALACTVYTPEAAPLIVFGSVATTAVSEVLRARGIDVRTSVRVHEDAAGRLTATPGGEAIEATNVIALPTLEGPGIAGLPSDEGGFIPIDEHARVKGVDDVYAAGDGTTFPIKQGGLATQQADAAAEHIAARLGADVDPQPFHPVLRGMLLTGGESLSLSHGLVGGEGEGSASADYLWWPPHKVSGRCLAPWLEGETARPEPEPPRRPLEVEVALPIEWHEQPMALDPHRGPELD
ncbi:MAG TPA: FAD-dependent oxidoreductase [Solirubrobacterales bacterium]